MNDVGMGQGDSSNRATAQSMTAEMQNTATAYQRILKTAIEDYIIKEMLYEIGYNPFMLTEDNMVRVKFPEIDLENRIKYESHIVDLYMKNAITEDEMRKAMAMDVIPESNRKKLFKELYPDAKSMEKASDVQNRPENQHGKASRPKVAKA